MNINTSNPVSFAGSFKSQKMPADKFIKAESDKILKFAKKADKYMKNSTPDTETVELTFNNDKTFNPDYSQIFNKKTSMLL